MIIFCLCVVDRRTQASCRWQRPVNDAVELFFRAIRQRAVRHDPGTVTRPVRLDHSQWIYSVLSNRSGRRISRPLLRLHRGQWPTSTKWRSLV